MQGVILKAQIEKITNEQNISNAAKGEESEAFKKQIEASEFEKKQMKQQIDSLNQSIKEYEEKTSKDKKKE